MGTLCVNPKCAIRDRHTATCDTQDCRGCQPRQAAETLNLCDLCTTRIAENALDAAKLWDDLAHQLIAHGGHHERVAASDGPPVPNPAVIAARDQIRGTLTGLARLIIEERRIQIPTVRRDGRRYTDTSTAACARLITRHAVWIAAHHAADEHAEDLHQAARNPKVRALAYPCRTRTRLYIGQCTMEISRHGVTSACDTRLYQDADQPLIACPTCGTTDTIEWWQRQIVGECDGEADAYQVAAYLAIHWMRVVDPALIRKWASLGRIQPVTVDGRAKRDGKRRVLYQLAAVTTEAARVWGKPARVCVSA